jgi:hypothetical protein
MVISAMTTQEIRRILLDEGVFKDIATADVVALDMCWRMRESDEYQDRLATLDALGLRAAVTRD